MEEEKSHLNVRWVAAAGIVVIVLALVGWWMSLPKVGQVFVIRPEDQSRTIYFPVTTQAASELENLTQAGDKVGLATLVLEERILVLPAGTRVVVTRHSWVHSLYQVQVLEGNLAMKTGWVPGRILSKLRTGPAISPR